jgi:hypothetical protein
MPIPTASLKAIQLDQEDGFEIQNWSLPSKTEER